MNSIHVTIIFFLLFDNTDLMPSLNVQLYT